MWDEHAAYSAPNSKLERWRLHRLEKPNRREYVYCVAYIAHATIYVLTS